MVHMLNELWGRWGRGVFVAITRIARDLDAIEIRTTQSRKIAHTHGKSASTRLRLCRLFERYPFRDSFSLVLPSFLDVALSTWVFLIPLARNLDHEIDA